MLDQTGGPAAALAVPLIGARDGQASDIGPRARRREIRTHVDQVGEVIAQQEGRYAAKEGDG